MKTILKIGGMSCENCVKHVTNALLEVPGVNSVEVNLEGNTATVEHDNDISLDIFKEAIDDIGYEVL